MDLHILKGLEVRFSDLRILKGLADFRHITSGIIPFGYRLSRVFGGGCQASLEMSPGLAR
jgi:hypothetical protein